MLIQFKKFFVLAAFPIAVFGSFLAGGAEPLYAAPVKVATSTTTYASLVKEIGKGLVEVKSVASPKFNLHFIEPRPSDVRTVRDADLFVFTGLDMEPWADPLLEAAGRPKLFRGGERNLDLSKGIQLLDMPQSALSRAQGDIHIFGNPHYWMNPENLKIMAQTMADKLSEIDPANEASYRENLRGFLERLDAKIAEWKTLCAHCAGKEIISYHKDIEYLAEFLGVRVSQTIEPLPGIPPTPKHLQSLEAYAKKNKVWVIVIPTFYHRASAEALAKRIGVPIVTVCQNAGEIPGTEDILGFYGTNVKNISEALK